MSYEDPQTAETRAEFVNKHQAEFDQLWAEAPTVMHAVESALARMEQIAVKNMAEARAERQLANSLREDVENLLPRVKKARAREDEYRNLLRAHQVTVANYKSLKRKYDALLADQRRQAEGNKVDDEASK